MSDFGEASAFDGRRRTGWAELATGETVELARIGARFAARLLDVIILAVLLFVVGLLLATVLLSGDEIDLNDFSASGINRSGIVISLLVGIGYEVVQTAVWGRTLGKRLVGVRVIHATHGGLPGWGKAFGRWAIPALPVVIPFIGVILSLLCYVSASWDRVYQGWHDKAAGTLVVKA